MFGIWSDPTYYIYAKCTPGKSYTYDEMESWSENRKCVHYEEGDSDNCYHFPFGMLEFYTGYRMSGIGGAEISPAVVEWSPEINEQVTEYSLDEECYVKRYTDGEEVSDEEYEKWADIVWRESK